MSTIANPVISIYNFEVRDQFGRLVTILNNPLQRRYSIYRNKPGSCQFILDAYDPQATATNIQLNLYDIVVRRNGTPVFAGQISYVEPAIDGDTKQIQIIATGYFDLLDQRMIMSNFPGFDAFNTNLPFGATDPSVIAWTLLNDTQFPQDNDGATLLQGATPTINQSFIPLSSTPVRRIKLLLKDISALGNMVLGIYTDLNNSPFTLVPNSQIIIPCATIGGVLGAELGWYEVDYPVNNQPILTNGTKYWIKASLDTSQTGSNGINWYWTNPAGGINGWYPNGQAYSPENPTLFGANQDLQFFIQQVDNSFQMNKNTYLGVEQGDIQLTGIQLSPIFSLYKKIKSAIEDISNAYNGIDFNISVQIDSSNNMKKFFNVFYPRQGISNTSLKFIYPGNIKKLNKKRDGKAMVNDAIIRGQGSGVAQITSENYDVTSIQNFSLRQDIDDNSDVADLGTLVSIGQEFIRVRKNPLDLPVIVLDGRASPQLGTYGIGDYVTVNINMPAFTSSIVNLNAIYRIEQFDVTVSDDDQEEVAITLAQT